MRDQVEPAERIWRLFEKNPENGCWEFKNVNHSNYGMIRIDGINQGAHRFMYTLFFGPIKEDGLHVRHKCDNRKCVNPSHLELGTPKENAYDMINRGRKALGEESGCNKLTENQVRSIRKEYSQGDIFYRELAIKYNCSYGAIEKIVQKRSWKHVE